MEDLYRNFRNESKSSMKQLYAALDTWSGVRIEFHQFGTILTRGTEWYYWIGIYIEYHVQTYWISIYKEYWHLLVNDIQQKNPKVRLTKK